MYPFYAFNWDIAQGNCRLINWFPCSVWYRGETTYLLYVSPPRGNQDLNDWYTNLIWLRFMLIYITYWFMNVLFLIFCISIPTSQTLFWFNQVPSHSSFLRHDLESLWCILQWFDLDKPIYLNNDAVELGSYIIQCYFYHQWYLHMHRSY